jgi:hypothetical protein
MDGENGGGAGGLFPFQWPREETGEENEGPSWKRRICGRAAGGCRYQMGHATRLMGLNDRRW